MNASVANPSEWTPERSAAGSHSPWLITFVISIATFMVVLDSSIANVALPHIAGDLAIAPHEATWVLTSFLVANAVIIPISGWLAEVIGRKRYYMISVALFTGASALCALAPNLTLLILARVLQGIGGGGLAPNEQSILADTFPPEKRGMAFAAYSVVVIVGPILGPTVGGYVTDTLSWHWIFLINLPFGILSLALVQRFVTEPPVMIAERRARWAQGIKIDYIGFVLVAIGLGSLTVMLDKGQEQDWFASGFIVAAAGLAAAALALLVFWELRQDNPIVRIRLLANRNFAVVIVVIFLVGVILFGSTQIIPQMLQEVYGYTALNAGLCLTLGGLGILAVMPLAGRLAGHTDPRWLIVPAFIMLTAGVWHFTTLTPQASFTDLALARLFQTIALPFVFVTINTIAYVGLKQGETGNASALLNVFRNIGGSVGISVSQTLLANNAQFYQARLTEPLSGLNPLIVDAVSRIDRATGVPGSGQAYIFEQIAHQARFLAYLDVYAMIALFMACCIPLFLLVRGGPALQGRHRGHGGLD